MTNQGLFSSVEKEETASQRPSFCTIDDQSSKQTESDDNTARDEPQFEKATPKATPPGLREERRKPYEPADLYECDRSLLSKNFGF